MCLPLQRRHFQRCPAAVDLEDDVVDRFCPDKRLGIGIVVFDVIVDGMFEFSHALENAAPDAVRGNFPEPALHEVQPR